MLNLLRKRWWKYISIVLLFYAIVAGLATPLATGITEVSPTKIKTGAVAELTIQAYNADFTQNDNLSLALKGHGHKICAASIEVLNSRSLKATFNLPANMKCETPSALYNLMGTSSDGQILFLSSAVIVEGDTAGTEMLGCDIDIENTSGISNFPYREILYESIRNLFYHVPMWFTMVMLLLFSFVSSLVYLNSGKHLHDVFASQAAAVGLLFGFLGIITGMTWATFTWGSPWPADPKLNGAAVGMLTYLAYFVLRGSLTDEIVRAKVAAVYNIFAFVLYIAFIFVIPRLTSTLHPGSGGNPAFSNYDLDNTLRPVFYSAAAGFIILGFWIMSLRVRYTLAKEAIEEQSINS